MRAAWPPLLLLCMLAMALLSPNPPLSGQEIRGFVRGDCNADGAINISDPIRILDYLFFLGSSIDCEDACDANDDGSLDTADVVLELGLLFGGQPPTLPHPYESCGVDRTADGLGCALGTCSIGVVLEERAFTLETGRVGVPYSGDLPSHAQEAVYWQVNGGPQNEILPGIPFVEYGLQLDDALPAGLSIAPATGVITGETPNPGLFQIQVWALRADGGCVRFHADLPVFSASESEIVTGQTLEIAGPYTPAAFNTFFYFTHELPWPVPYPLYGCDPVQPPPQATELKALRVYYPANATGELPILIFHHGTGYDWTQYEEVLVHLATHGVICASVNDQFSYFGYTDYYCWGGHDEGARVLLAGREVLEGLAATPQHVLFERIDWGRLFYGGHSRGGASAMIARELDPEARGVLALQATDARRDSWVGYTNRWISFPDVPVLNITAEQDSDVIYPYSERLLERFTGPATMVTIYGGCHGFSTDDASTGCSLCDWTPDSPFVDSCRYIAREYQHQITKRFATAFLLRYGFGDLSTEGLLYGDENEGSVFMSAVYRRNLTSPILVDDFSAYPTNSLGFDVDDLNSFLYIDQGACYDWPFPTPQPISAIHNLVMMLPSTGTATLISPLGAPGNPLDVSGKKRLLLRIKNHDIHGVPDNFGFSWLDLTLTLGDEDGDEAVLPLDSHLPSVVFHPQPEPATISVLMKYQRFLTVAIGLGDFLALNPALDLDRLMSLELEWITDGSASVNIRMGLDDIQFE